MINAILIALLYGVGIPDTIYDTALSVPGCPSCSLDVGRALEHLQERGQIVVVHVPDTVYVIEVGYEHQLWLERDTVEAKAVPRRSGALWYVPLTDGRDVWCDRARILSKKER